MKFSRLIWLPIIFLCVISSAHAQGSGVLDPSRVPGSGGWTGAGAGTIPARATICATVSMTNVDLSAMPPVTSADAAAANGAAIRSAAAGCTSGQAVLIPSSASSSTNDAGGNPAWYVDFIWWGTSLSTMVNGVTIRGAGANTTFLILLGGSCNGLGPAGACMLNGSNDYSGGPDQTANWTAGYSKGTTALTFSNTTNLRMGSQIILDQLDDTSDGGSIFVCATTGSGASPFPCSQQGSTINGRTNRHQNQVVTVVSVVGSTVNITPGLYAPNWRSGQSPGAWWSNDNPINGDGIESMSLDCSALNPSAPTGCIEMVNAAFDWAKDVKGVDSTGNVNKMVWLYQANNITVRDSYFYGSNGSSESYGVDSGASTCDNLVENNIGQHVATPWITEGACGTVFAYNFAIDDYYNGGGSAPQWQQEDQYHHSAGDNYTLNEGNEGIGHTDDDIHGSSFMGTSFRVFINGRDPALTPDLGSGDCAPYSSPCPKFQQTSAFSIMAYNRFANLIGVVFGTAGYHTTYKRTPGSSSGCSDGLGNVTEVNLGCSGDQGTTFNNGSFTIPNDGNVSTTAMLWGYVDALNGGSGGTAFSVPQFNSGEVPSGISLYSNAVPGSHTLPNSLYLPSAGASAPPFNHTAAGNPPWPMVGPDVSGGNITGVGGYANHNAAALCALNIMGINPNGSSGVKAFDISICGYYTGGGGGSPTVVLSLTSGGGSASSYNFGSVVAGGASATQQIWVNNTGTGPLTITPPITGSDNTDFPFIMNQCASSGFTVAASSSCYMEMQFTPALMATGSLSSTLTVTDNASGSPHTFTLNGTVTGGTPPVVAPGTPSIISIIAQ